MLGTTNAVVVRGENPKELYDLFGKGVVGIAITAIQTKSSLDRCVYSIGLIARCPPADDAGRSGIVESTDRCRRKDWALDAPQIHRIAAAV